MLPFSRAVDGELPVDIPASGARTGLEQQHEYPGSAVLSGPQQRGVLLVVASLDVAPVSKQDLGGGRPVLCRGVRTRVRARLGVCACHTAGRHLAGGDVQGGTLVVRPSVDGSASAWPGLRSASGLGLPLRLG